MKARLGAPMLAVLCAVASVNTASAAYFGAVSYRNCGTVQEGSACGGHTIMVTRKRVVWEQQQETRYRTVRETVWEKQEVEGQRQVAETHYRTENYTVSVPVQKQVEQTYTVMEPQPRTRTETYTVCVPSTIRRSPT